MSSKSARTAQDLLRALDSRYPLAWASDWDNVGLVIGDPEMPVSGIRVTLDATAEAVERTVEGGGNLLVTHHPPFLTVPEKLSRACGPEGTLEAALRREVAVISLHTNLDRSPEGASALAELLGLRVGGPVESASEPVTAIVTYVPPDAAEVVRLAMSAAGAGRMGRYEDCSFTAAGTGRFTALESAAPRARDTGDGVPEVRIEMVCAPSSAERVMQAARYAHPYEEPLVLALQGSRVRGIAAFGRVCSWRDGATVAELAAHAAATLGNACRVWGAPGEAAGRIAVGNGSAGSLVPEAARVADTLLAGEVRYHDALAAVAAGLTVIECGHDSTEWPLVDLLGRAVSQWDASVPLTVESRAIGWWTMEDPNVRG